MVPSVFAEYASFGDAMHMSKLGQMKFHQGQDTTYKRSSPIPQLRCVKGCEFEPCKSCQFLSNFANAKFRGYHAVALHHVFGYNVIRMCGLSLKDKRGTS